MKTAYGDSRKTKKWKNNDISWEDFCRKVAVPVRTTETVDEYKKLGKARHSGSVLSRSMLTLDMDYGVPGIEEEIEMFFGFGCCIYSTHKHTPKKPRLRIIIPLSRDVSEEEYPAVARQVAKDIGLDLFDDTTYQPHRLMYWPSVSSNGEYLYKVIEGDVLDSDDYLARYNDWRDISTHPVSSRKSEAITREAKEQADPLEKPGIVGTFCRCYGIKEAIEVFLADVYEPSVMPGRYDYIPADSSARVVVYEDKFAYSHHATDPACGVMMNAFDMVRLHRFPNDDPKKSFSLMEEFAVKDERVNALLLQETAKQEFDDWTKGFRGKRAVRFATAFTTYGLL